MIYRLIAVYQIAIIYQGKQRVKLTKHKDSEFTQLTSGRCGSRVPSPFALYIFDVKRHN